jgi:hypothetical protein
MQEAEGKRAATQLDLHGREAEQIDKESAHVSHLEVEEHNRQNESTVTTLTCRSFLLKSQRSSSFRDDGVSKRDSFASLHYTLLVHQGTAL